MNCLVIACSQRKRDPRTLSHSTLPDGTPVAPAWAVYDGTQMRIVRKHAPYRDLDILILSARFGLISPSFKIPLYDRRMTRDRAQNAAWISEHITDRWTLVQTHTYQTVYTCLPRLYRAALIAGLRPLDIEPLPIVKQGASQGLMAQALKRFCLARRQQTTSPAILREGMSKYQVFYAKTPLYCLYGHRGHLDRVTVARLSETHVLVREVEAESKGEVYCLMQGEIWSPRGEARPLIERLGLSHTSMSIGDVVKDQGGRHWLCVEMGWKELES